MNIDSTWFAVLVIVLSIFLGIFLIVAILLITKVLQIVKQIKKILEHAESVADKAEHITEFFEKTSTPVAFLKLISNVSNSIQKKAKRK